MKQQIPAAFGIHIIDESTGRGVPLVELETVHRVLFLTDSAGWVAITDPGLMNTEVFFHIRSHGYAYPKDAFGYAGVRLMVKPGERAEVKIRRVNIAERLCRLTGEGIYGDSIVLGEPCPLREPVRNAQVVGQDSALAVVYRGQMRWFWGDTSRTSYPLGNFRTTGATATLPKGRSSAEAGLDFAYETDAEGFSRQLVPSTKPGPIWIGGVTTLKEGGQERLIAHYSRMKDLGTRLEQGYVVWDDGGNVFRRVKEIPLTEEWRFLDGHPIRFTENGKDHLAGGFCFPLARVPARLDRVFEPSAYEAFTCLNKRGEVQRDGRGKVVYRWQSDAPPITPKIEAALVKKGKLKLGEARFLMRDAKGQIVEMHGGSVNYNPFRKRWILIGNQSFGKESHLGEIYYAEADGPTGPWRHAVKIMTHDRYTFYNPVHHPFLDSDGGRVIYFEGTYSAEFSGNPRPTPRYDYNQILYRLDLSDGRLNFTRRL